MLSDTPKKMILELIEPIRLMITSFLNLPIYQTGNLVIDFYSIIHIISGFFIFTLITKFHLFKKDSIIYSKFGVLFLILFAWEMFEYLMISQGVMYMGLPAFKTEQVINQFVDIGFGMIGGLWAWFKK